MLLKDHRSGGGSGHFPWSQQEFTPTLGQITFIISSLPADIVSVEFYVNGVIYREGAGEAYTLSGSTITWLNTFILKSEDEVIARYQ